ncbi:MAG: YifB family Mg chelatase-like AAA ATPase [Rickettsiales bacterium]|nr:YifB family Mg chelatase-like AAA ATPase [Pseudomonadota bacterium]MDA0965766.1 YifB family Mg chelatase-like AAA ATPase [Pseudomonadota bacterium]MDG4543772.1 YifB family Mg chelatase-like AAA ATPase [Rickettsiales bacterium]MDG4545919.1 YifB family Mg chelatase-like AAA ATPase [Rickettsiales bacterium]MDG4548165.1 YifB family Mg chelatase-like AAA ATPase [Rickettsiales bacterium]
MVAHINTVAFQGITPKTIDVQVHIASGIPAFSIVGLPDKAVGESKERIRSAMNSLGLSLPPSRMTVNLAPADVIKEGSHYDLAIALGLMIEMNVLKNEELADYVVLGELSLDGSVTTVAGTLPAAIHAASIGKGIICPVKNGPEACWAGEIEILAASNLLELINHFKGTQVITPPTIKFDEAANTNYPDLRDIKGQESAKRALEVAASGNHNMLMTGPPGSGKSMLASRLPGIIPELSSNEMLDVSMIESISNNLEDGKIKRVRPFRDPHHSCSMAAMIGGGKRAMPGEITLAHNGVLFLDELPEFPRQVLDSLRQPLETGQVTVSRVNAHVTYPANFQLVAAMNPCRCGYLGDADRACNKAPKCAVDYQSKISGPLFDRIDIHIEVPPVTPMDLSKEPAKEGSTEVLQRVKTAREIQAKRYEGLNITTNSQADGEILLQVASPDNEGKKILDTAYEKMGLSMRGYNRVLRVARTIADMQDNEKVKKEHIWEALSYRKVNLR